VSFIGASFTKEIWHLVLSQGICFGFGMGFCFTATVGVVAQWFKRRRSFANALSTAGSGFGGLTYSLATNAMISNLGLPWAFRILAVIGFVVVGICSLTMRDRNKAVGAVHIAFHSALFLRPEFWLFMGWGFFAIISYIIVVFSLTDYAVQVGFSTSQGSLAAAIFNLSQGIGRPLIGLVSDKVGRMNVAGLGTLVAALAAFVFWIPAGQHYAGLIIYAVFGAFAGIIWPTVAPVGAEVVGLQLLPSALSIYWIVLVLPATFAEVIGLSLRTPGINGYLHVQLLTGILYMVAFVSIWLLRSWKLCEMESQDLAAAESSPEPGDTDRVAAGSETLGRRPSCRPREKLIYSYISKMFVVEVV
jgi:MFS family permease